MGFLGDLILNFETHLYGHPAFLTIGKWQPPNFFLTSILEPRTVTLYDTLKMNLVD